MGAIQVTDLGEGKIRARQEINLGDKIGCRFELKYVRQRWRGLSSAYVNKALTKLDENIFQCFEVITSKP